MDSPLLVAAVVICWAAAPVHSAPKCPGDKTIQLPKNEALELPNFISKLSRGKMSSLNNDNHFKVPREIGMPMSKNKTKKHDKTEQKQEQ
jgi:hypothetical protein